MHFIKNRKPRALIAYGPLDDFIPETGVPQGGVESPLTWIFAYNISILMTSAIENLCMCFNTSEQTEHAINLLIEINIIAPIRANPMKLEYVTFIVKARLIIKVNDQLIYSVDKNKNICLLGSF
jgi:hypothetical protein